jgi:hypothetical protein
MILASPMVRVITRREEKLRAEMAALARAIAASRDGLAVLDETIAAVERRARDNANSRFAQGPRSVAALLEIERNSSSLHAGRAELETMRERSRQTLATLTDQQCALSKKWRKEDARLAHVTALARRQRVLADVRQTDADDESFAERR